MTGSFPRNSIGSEEACRFRWTGPGKTAFLVPSPEAPGPGGAGEGGPAGALLEVGSVEEAGEAIRDRASPSALQTIEKFFRSGGACARVLFVPARAGEAAQHWIGEDGGFGERTGLYALRDGEDVGSVVMPPLSARQLDSVLKVAVAVSELFFFLETALPQRSRQPRTRAEESGGMDRPLHNVAVLRPRGQEPGLSGALAGLLDSMDPEEGRIPGVGERRRRPPAEVAARFPSEDLQALGVWRFWSGLRRSLDLGSRWVVFEPDEPLLRRRLEREARDFFHRAAMGGLLPPWGGRDLDVTCESVEEAGGRRLILRVQLPLAAIREAAGPAARSTS